MPLVQTRGAASAQGFGEFAQVTAVNYIEDVFSTYLVTPTSSNTTYSVTNGVDVSGKGGMVWMKSRSSAGNNLLYDTVRGASAGSNNALISNNTSGQQTAYFDYVTPNTNGFTVNFATGGGQLTNNGINYVSWTFRKQPKFFDVLTYTGTGSAGLTVNHNLGSVPGTIIVKITSGSGSWFVYHRSLGATKYINLNATGAAGTSGGIWNNTEPTSSVFTLGNDGSVNSFGQTYVAYLFAHNAGGFGLTGTDNVISCGSFVTDGSGNATVNLGYEPQWLLTKQSSGAGGQDWYLVDTMRPWSLDTGADGALRPNLANAEYVGDYGFPTATGFYQTGLNASATHIYIAIRRGPMKVPTSGTSVFAPTTYTGNNANRTVTTGIVTDLTIIGNRSNPNYRPSFMDRLRGTSAMLNDTSHEGNYPVNPANNGWAVQNGFTLVPETSGVINYNTWPFISWNFRRAPSFFDEVCYTGTGASSQVLTHNLTVTPQLTIFKKRSATNPWDVVSGNTSYMQLNQSYQASPDTSIAATSTTITAPLGAGNGLNASGATYVAYLFATCAGVSKVGSYTGNGSSQTINCGFTGGARFVLIKRTDDTGDWMISDSARGIVSGSDPYLELNNTNAEVTGEDWLDTDSTGFVVNEVSGSNANTSSATYIFLTIA